MYIHSASSSHSTSSPSCTGQTRSCRKGDTNTNEMYCTKYPSQYTPLSAMPRVQSTVCIQCSDSQSNHHTAYVVCQQTVHTQSHPPHHPSWQSLLFYIHSITHWLQAKVLYLLFTLSVQSAHCLCILVGYKQHSPTHHPTPPAITT